MASSGQVTISTQSVDYGGGRGAVWLTNVVGWSVNDDGYISFTSINSSDNAGGTWGICGTASNYGLVLEPQVSYDGGGSWNSLDSKFYEAAICPSLTNTIAISTTLIAQLGSYKLSSDCQLRFLYYANREPAPSASLPNAFPSSSYSAAVQVPVQVDVSWTATLQYNDNGGTGAPAAQTSSQSGDSATFTISSTTPTRKNYRFEGWATSSTSSPQYQPGSSFVIYKTSPVQTLFAIWEKFYHPGAVYNGSAWLSHDKSGGACQILNNVESSEWLDMRTIDAPTGLGDPPAVLHDDKYYNQQKIGKE